MSTHQSDVIQKPRWSKQIYKKLLRVGKKKRTSTRLQYINKLDDNTIICLVELISNVLKGNVRIDKKIKKVLNSEKQSLRRISQMRDLTNVRSYLNQTGGSPVAVLLPLLASVVSSIITNVI